MSSSYTSDDVLIPYEEIAAATNSFADENLISQGRTTGIKLYKGQLTCESGRLINIVAGLYRHPIATVNEFGIRYVANHKNINSVYKLCVMSNEKDVILIRKYVANGGLNKYLSGPQTLTWMQRLRICVGVAHVLSYLHNDVTVCSNGRSIIHGNIKSTKILLDEHWEPKLSGFVYSMTVKKGDAHRPGEYWDKSVYRDPAYNDTKCLNHKTDVFSFGVVLFEVLFGATYTSPNERDNWYFTHFARKRYEEKRLDDRINPDLRKQMSLQSLNIFSETAYFCLKEERSQRPDIVQVVRKLEKALHLQQKHDQTQEHFTATTSVASSISSKLKGKNIDHLKIQLSDIELATQNFSEICKIGSGGYGAVYKAELYHFDSTNSSAIEAKNESEFPKICSTVAIKRIFKRNDTQGEQGFIREIELLSNCKHPNIVSLVGYCDDGPEMILIYEYVANGSLENYLGNPDNLINLSWAQRIQISIDIAHGLSYLHTSIEEKEMIIHRDMKSANVLLDGNWVSKIADFGLSKLCDANQQCSTLVTEHVAGTDLYLDPEYNRTGKLKKASDIYSFGVVLFELLCGRLAYDSIYYDNDQQGLPSIVRGQPFDIERLKKMVDPKIMESDANILKITGRVNQDSLETFIAIAYKCLAETQAQRPLMETIITELEKSLEYQKNSNNNLVMSYNEIKLATKNFSDYKCLEDGRLWQVYEGEAIGDIGCNNNNIVKRWDVICNPKYEDEFLTELEVLFKYKHECIIGLAGYCIEHYERIIVYEHGYNRRLNEHLDNVSLTWMKRLKIGIDVATGLDFLHTGGGAGQEYGGMMHRDIKSSCILLNRDFKPKISNLHLCNKGWEFEKVDRSIDHSSSYGSLGYVDPYTQTLLSEKKDIYSLGVVLIEMLCGRLALPVDCDDDQSLVPLSKHHYYKQGNLNEMIFESINGQIVPQSLTAFQTIVIQCLNYNSENRPSAHEVVVQLKRALEFQEDAEIWELKLPEDYKEIIKMSTTPDIYSTKTRKELYQIFHKGVLLQQGKVFISLSDNEDYNETISARMFSYENDRSHKSRSVQNPRFPKVVWVLDISKLNIQIKIKPQFLSQNVNYGAYLVFKLCNPRKFSNQPIYVNLKYQIGGETLHAYFATWRDDKWMQIELCRFLHDEKYTDFEVQLKSFSRYYCGREAYIEGIEFRAINDVSLKPGIYEKQGVQPIDDNHSTTKSEDCEKLSSQSESNLRKFHMLPAKTILSDSYNAKCFVWKSLPGSRFEEVAEFISDQVFQIKCQIESQELSPNTDYRCYLIFTLAEKCGGLQCPVKIRENKMTKFIYFRTPRTLNLHNIKRVPKLRDDGLMEVIVREFNSNELKGDRFLMNLKLKCYEGSMCGLIVHRIEFQPL